MIENKLNLIKSIDIFLKKYIIFYVERRNVRFSPYHIVNKVIILNLFCELVYIYSG